MHMGKKNKLYNLHEMRNIQRKFITGHPQVKQSALIRKVYIKEQQKTTYQRMI